MSRLSSLLVRDRVVDVGTLERAFRRKDLEGGRLGTILLELGAVDEPTFQYYLGLAVGLPAPTESMLASIDDEVLGLIDVRDALAYGVLPAELQGETLQVLVRDPLDDETVSRLEERIGHPLQQFVLLDFRFEHALAELYGVRPSPRASALIARFPAKVGRSGMTGSHAIAGDEDPAGGSPPAPSGPILTRLGTSWTADQLHRFLAHCDSRDDIVQALLGFAHNLFPRCFVLAVSQGSLRGFASKCPGVDVETLREVKLDDSRLLRRAQAKGTETVFEGLAPDLGVLGLYDGLELKRPLEVACFVLRIGSRPAMFLVGDNEQRPVPRSALPAVESAVVQAAAALIRLVRVQKRAQKLSGAYTAPRKAVRDEPLSVSPVERALAKLDGGWEVSAEPDLAEAVGPGSAAQAEHPLVGREPGGLDDDARMTDTDPERPRAIRSASDAYEAVAESEPLDADDDELDDLMFGEIERLVMEEHGGDESAGAEAGGEMQPTLMGMGGVAEPPPGRPSGMEVLAAREPRAESPTAAAPEPEPDLVPPPARDFDGPGAMIEALAADDRALALRARAAVMLGGQAVLDELTERFPGPIEVTAEKLLEGDGAASVDAIGPFFPVILELGQRYLPALQTLASDPLVERRLYATASLRDVRHTDNVAVLGERLFDDHPAVRRAAAAVLKTYRDDPTMPSLLARLRAALDHDDEARRLAACGAVAELGDEKAVPRLIERLADPVTRVAEAAAAALEGLTFQAFGDLRKWRRWYKKHGGDSRAEWLVAGAVSRQPRARELVSEALERAPGLSFHYDPAAGRRQLKRMANDLSEHLKLTGTTWL